MKPASPARKKKQQAELHLNRELNEQFWLIQTNLTTVNLWPELNSDLIFSFNLSLRSDHFRFINKPHPAGSYV